MRILLARHGETPWNAEGRYQGQIDIPLSPVGEAQARGGDQAAGLPGSRGLRERRTCMASLRESSAVPLPAILAKR